MCLDEGNTFLKTLIALFCRIDLRRPQNTTDLFRPCLHKFFCRSPSTVFVISCNKITKDRVNSTVEQYKRHTIILYRMKRFGQAIVFFQCARCYHGQAIDIFYHEALYYSTTAFHVIAAGTEKTIYPF